MHSRELVSTLARAEKSLHQLVGDVIVLGQQLAGEIERDRTPARRARRVQEAYARHGRARRSMPRARMVPLLAADHGMKHAVSSPSVSPSAEPFEHSRPKLAGMIRVARDRRAAAAIGLGQHAAADAAIRTGGAHSRRVVRRGVHECGRSRSCRLSGGLALGERAAEHHVVANALMSAAAVRISSRYQSASRDIAEQDRADRADPPQSRASCRCRA